MLPTPRMPPLAWFWTGLLATGTASAACLQWLGPPPRAAVAAMAPPAMAPPAVAPPGVLEVAAVAHATYLLADPALAAEAVTITLPVPPMPPARHPRTPRHVSLAQSPRARRRRPPAPAAAAAAGPGTGAVADSVSGAAPRGLRIFPCRRLLCVALLNGA